MQRGLGRRQFGIGQVHRRRPTRRTAGASYRPNWTPINHQPDWTPLPVDEFRRQVSAIDRGESWVIDGNYSAVRDIVWARADTVVWLDLPRWLVMKRVTTRTLGRVVRRRELWNGNRERWRNIFTLDKDESVILWSWTQHGKYHDRYEAARRDPANAHLRFVQLPIAPRDRRLPPLTPLTLPTVGSEAPENGARPFQQLEVRRANGVHRRAWRRP